MQEIRQDAEPHFGFDDCHSTVGRVPTESMQEIEKNAKPHFSVDDHHSMSRLGQMER